MNATAGYLTTQMYANKQLADIRPPDRSAAINHVDQQLLSINTETETQHVTVLSSLQSSD